MTWQTVVDQPDELGESPFWHPDEQALYRVDIAGRLLHRANVVARSVENWAMPSEPGCMAPARTNGVCMGLVIALRDGIYRGRCWAGRSSCWRRRGTSRRPRVSRTARPTRWAVYGPARSTSRAVDVGGNYCVAM